MAVDFPKEAEKFAPTATGFEFCFRLVHDWQDPVSETVEADVTSYTSAGRNYDVVGSAQVCHWSGGGPQMGAILGASAVVERAGRRYLQLTYNTLIHPPGAGSKIFRIQFIGTVVKR